MEKHVTGPSAVQVAVRKTSLKKPKKKDVNLGKLYVKQFVNMSAVKKWENFELAPEISDSFYCVFSISAAGLSSSMKIW